MQYKIFYNLYNDYNFMLLSAVHYGVYSENLFKSIQDRLEKCICGMLFKPECMEYKNSLKELYGYVIRGEDIRGFQPLVRELYKKMTYKRILKDILVYAACFCLCTFTGIILKKPLFH